MQPIKIILVHNLLLTEMDNEKILAVDATTTTKRPFGGINLSN